MTCAVGCDVAARLFTPEPPLKITGRYSLLTGTVAQISNLDTKPIAIEAFALSRDRKTRSELYRCVVKSGETEEIGMLELGGWAIEDGEKLVVSSDGYATMQYVPNGKSFSVGRYSDDD